MQNYKLKDIVKYWTPSETVLINIRGVYLVDWIGTINPIFNHLEFPNTYFIVSRYTARKIISELKLINVKKMKVANTYYLEKSINYAKPDYFKKIFNDLYNDSLKHEKEIELAQKHIRDLRLKKSNLRNDYLAIDKMLRSINE